MTPRTHFIFYQGILRYSIRIYSVYHCHSYNKTLSGTQRWIWNKTLKYYPSFCRQCRIRLFHIVVLQRTVKKWTNNYKARAQPLFCSLNLSFSDLPIAVAIMVFLNSLMTNVQPQQLTKIGFKNWENTRKSHYDQPHCGHNYSTQVWTGTLLHHGFSNKKV